MEKVREAETQRDKEKRLRVSIVTNWMTKTDRYKFRRIYQKKCKIYQARLTA